MSKIKQWLSTFLTVCLTLTLSLSLIAVPPAFAGTEFTVYGEDMTDIPVIMDLNHPDTECETGSDNVEQLIMPYSLSDPAHIGMRTFCNDLTRGISWIDVESYEEGQATLKLYQHEDCGLQNVKPTSNFYPSAIPVRGCTIQFDSF